MRILSILAAIPAALLITTLAGTAFFTSTRDVLEAVKFEKTEPPEIDWDYVCQNVQSWPREFPALKQICDARAAEPPKPEPIK
jgi:hypothetical protein